MPKIQSHTIIDVTPEKFLNACDSTELHELELMLSKPEYQQKMGRRGWRPANWYAVEANSSKPEVLNLDPQTCHQCGCTDLDCTGCIEKTGAPCHWVAENLCSACAENSPKSKL